MRSQRLVVFKQGKPQHVYSRNKQGNVLFYTIRDYLFVLTLFYAKVKKHDVRVESFCVMPNHLHYLAYFESAREMAYFLWDFHKSFNAGYQYSNGKEVMSSFGSVPKSFRKAERSCDVYIDNNPVAGNICSKAIDYKWNLMAYRDCSGPFPPTMKKSAASYRLGKSFRKVDYFHSHGMWLGYQILEQLFHGLDSAEEKQLAEYIVFKFNPLDYELKDSLYNSREDELQAKDSTTGNEHDMKEEWEDHSIYLKLVSEFQREDYNFEVLDEKELRKIQTRMNLLFPGKEKQIRRFLHI